MVKAEYSSVVFSPIEPAPLQYLITRRIVHAIFSGQLAGGARLIEQELATQFRISFQDHLAAIQDHVLILEAFRHRDSEKAVRAMREHLKSAAENAVRRLFFSSAQPQKV